LTEIPDPGPGAKNGRWAEHAIGVMKSIAIQTENGLPLQHVPLLRCWHLNACAGRRARPVFALLAALCGLTLPAGGAEKADPAFHPSVGQKFVPENVDWDRPVYRTGFDDASELSRWRLEDGKRVSIANGKLVLESEPGRRENHLVCWLTTVRCEYDHLVVYRLKP
jgi:hypothetical protein